MSRCLREGSPDTAPQVAEEMLRWTLLFSTPAARRLAERRTNINSRRDRFLSVRL
jgi:hypothetical protein